MNLTDLLFRPKGQFNEPVNFCRRQFDRIAIRSNCRDPFVESFTTYTLNAAATASTQELNFNVSKLEVTRFVDENQEILSNPVLRSRFEYESLLYDDIYLHIPGNIVNGRAPNEIGPRTVFW